ncbi:MAG TPA: ATP-binding protein [Gaiellaceae bacterium]|nr:ATP-binding protein [Gaiellaceae bacterium]
MRPLPIRLRVAAAFAVAMLLVLAGTGAFLYERLGSDLSNALDQDLRLRAQDLRALVEDPRGSLAGLSSAPLVESGESFAQLLDSNGRVVEGTPPLQNHALLDSAEQQRAANRAIYANRPSVPGLDEPARMLAVPVQRGTEHLVLVVGATRENRAEALRNLRNEFLIVGPIALILATGAGYLLAGAGLRTVDEMRRRATQISAERLDERLPVPHTRDELERLGHTLNDMLARLEQALERERGFVAEAGHELRTPLALLRAELDLALRHAQDEQELRAALRAASEETDRLAQLAEGLLLIASSDQGELRLRQEKLVVEELLASVRNRFLWRSEDAARGIEIEVPGGLEVVGDRLRLEQALGNLLDNALRHGQGTVRLEARSLNGTVEIHVHDEGPGFPEPFLARAFERFSRADEGRSGDGAGLGLAIVAAISRSHGGSAEARNAAGGGADVWIALRSRP